MVTCAVTGRIRKPGEAGWWHVRADGEFCVRPYSNQPKHKRWLVVSKPNHVCTLFLKWATTNKG